MLSLFTTLIVGTALGRALRQLGRDEEACSALHAACSQARANESGRSLWPALDALAELEEKRGSSTEAERLRVEARGVIDFILAHLPDPALRVTMLALPQVCAIMGG